MSGSFGVDLKIMISTTLTAITKLLDVEFPEQVAEVADNTPHDAASGYRTRIKTGVFSLEPFSATLEWDSDETTHAAVLTAFAATTAVTMAIASPGDDETIQFSGHVTRVGRITPLSGVYTAKVEITPTGAPTIT